MDGAESKSWVLAAFELGGSGELDAEEIGRSEQPVWLHLDRHGDGTRRWLVEGSGLDTSIVEELLAESTRPRTAIHGDGVLLTLRGVNLNPGARPEDMISVRMWVDPGRVISLQGKPLMAIASLIENMHRGKGPQTVGGFAVAILDGLTERMSPVIEQIRESLDDLESRIVDPNLVVDRAELIEMRLRVIALYRYISPQASALTQLSVAKLSMFEAEHRTSLQGTLNSVIRLVEDLESAKSRCAILQDEFSNQLAEQANQRVYVVTVIAAIFLPLTLITGLLGMNVGGIPLQTNRLGFAMVTGGIVVLGLIAWILVRRNRWL